MSRETGKKSPLPEARCIGYRAWRVDDDGWLSSSNNHHRWDVGVNKALCKPPGSSEANLVDQEHKIPHIDCDCGIYAYYRPRPEAVRLGELMGPVLLWGDAVMHHERIRAEFAEVGAIMVPSAFKREPEADADADERKRLTQEWERIDKAASRYGVPLIIKDTPEECVKLIEAEFGPHIPEDLIPPAER